MLKGQQPLAPTHVMNSLTMANQTSIRFLKVDNILNLKEQFCRDSLIKPNKQNIYLKTTRIEHWLVTILPGLGSNPESRSRCGRKAANFPGSPVR